MNEIKINVDDKNLDAIVMILNSLKDGMLHNFSVNGKSTDQRSTKYQPKTTGVIREENSGENDRNGKYLSPSSYKQRQKNKKKS